LAGVLLVIQRAFTDRTLKLGRLFLALPGYLLARLTIMKFPALAFPLLLNLAQYVIIKTPWLY
jgi:hypothetical protein